MHSPTRELSFSQLICSMRLLQGKGNIFYSAPYSLRELFLHLKMTKLYNMVMIVVKSKLQAILMQTKTPQMMQCFYVMHNLNNTIY